MEMPSLAASKISIIPKIPTVLINPSAPASYYRAEGMIKNVNTIEEYRNLNRSKMLHQAAQTVKKK
jgi:hypothetical protein